jgi:hypothetical protein
VKKPLQRIVDTLNERIDSAVGPRVLSKREALEVLEEVLSHVEASVDALKEELGDDAA